MGKRWVTIVAVCAVLASAGTALADGRVKGTTRTAEGSPIEGVELQLVPTDPSMPTLKATSRSDGEFVFGLVRKANYRLVAYKDGMRVSHIDVSIEEGGNEVWSHAEAATPGYELPTFTVTGIRVVQYDLQLEPWEGDAGPYGTGKAMSLQDIIGMLERGENDAAVSALEAALQGQPDQPTLNYLYAFGLRLTQRLDEALAAIDKTIAAQPDFEGAQLLRARVLEEQARMEEAAAAYRAETEVAQSTEVLRDAWLGLGRVRLGMKDGPGAVEALERVREIAPDEAAAIRLLADAYVMTGDQEKASEMMAMVGELGDEDPNVLYNLGAQRYNEGEFEAAADYFARVIAAAPDYADAYYQLGLTRLSQDDRPAALENLTKYLELDPDGANAETARGLVEALGK